MNISLTSLEEAWGSDFKIDNTASHVLKRNNIYKSKKHQKQMLRKQLEVEESTQEPEEKSIVLKFTDDKIINYLKRYTNEYQLLHITELLNNFINKHDKLITLPEEDNDVSERMLVYILILLIGVLLFDRFIKHWKN
tara:strand:- start:317 stop:727 length:411 start_codon:yes stop_codon:yes gene_type:complete